jgi:hypothetical protein
MSTQRKPDEVKELKGQQAEVSDDETVDDVEGHFMAVPFPVARELARSREHEIERGVARHTLIAQAKNKAHRSR